MEDMNVATLSCFTTVLLHCRLQQYLGLVQIFSTKMSSLLHRDKSECITWTMPSDKVPEDQEVALSSLSLSSSLSEGQKLASFSVAVLPFESSNSSALGSSDIPPGNVKHCRLLTTLCSISALFIYICVSQIPPLFLLYSSAARWMAAGWHW